jgi:ribosomal protein S18 acetylase RimI-like enzyme
MRDLGRLLRIFPVKTSEHLLFDLYNYLYFRTSEEGSAIMIIGESKLVTLLIAPPYIFGSELAFFRESRYFVKLDNQVAAVFVLREEPDAIYIASLAVAPKYRRHGLATCIVDFSAKVANRLGKKSVELTVLKKNTAARELYKKLGFLEKHERKRSLALRKKTTEL